MIPVILNLSVSVYLVQCSICFFFQTCFPELKKKISLMHHLNAKYIRLTKSTVHPTQIRTLKVILIDYHNIGQLKSQTSQGKKGHWLVNKQCGIKPNGNSFVLPSSPLASLSLGSQKKQLQTANICIITKLFFTWV